MNVTVRTVRRKTGRAQVDVRPDPAALLSWYDGHARKLPWRAGKGERADPYRVWLSEIMLQQTTVKVVAEYYARFLARWPDVRSLAAAPLGEVLKAWAGLGYYARARNLHACARMVVDTYGGRFPADEEALRALPGVGPYTAAAIAAIAFGRRATPVDGNVERVVARLYAVDAPLPAAKLKISALAAALTPVRRPGDFAQALMDLGATICTPKRPACSLCPWSKPCVAYAGGNSVTFPRKMPKREGKPRRGAAFVAIRAGCELLVRTRPVKGLLGGMTEVPTTEWTNDFDGTTALEEAPRFKVKWRRTPGVVKHTFTHFPLELDVYVATVAARAKAPTGTRWIGLGDVGREALPSVMRKVVAHALDKTQGKR